MLSDLEAKKLIEKEKIFIDHAAIELHRGAKDARDLESMDRADNFILDYRQSSINFSKVTRQMRTQSTIVLVRLDIAGPPHTNPDGRRIGGTHMHIYKDGFEDKFAEEVDPNIFSDTSNMKLTMEQFCDYCNISKIPLIVEQLII